MEHTLGPWTLDGLRTEHIGRRIKRPGLRIIPVGGSWRPSFSAHNVSVSDQGSWPGTASGLSVSVRLSPPRRRAIWAAYPRSWPLGVFYAQWRSETFSLLLATPRAATGAAHCTSKARRETGVMMTKGDETRCGRKRKEENKKRCNKRDIGPRHNRMAD